MCGNLLKEIFLESIHLIKRHISKLYKNRKFIGILFRYNVKYNICTLLKERNLQNKKSVLWILRTKIRVTNIGCDSPKHYLSV